jgi:hypothetical protein
VTYASPNFIIYVDGHDSSGPINYSGFNTGSSQLYLNHMSGFSIGSAEYLWGFIDHVSPRNLLL